MIRPRLKELGLHLGGLGKACGAQTLRNPHWVIQKGPMGSPLPVDSGSPEEAGNREVGMPPQGWSISLSQPFRVGGSQPMFPMNHKLILGGSRYLLTGP